MNTNDIFGPECKECLSPYSEFLWCSTGGFAFRSGAPSDPVVLWGPHHGSSERSEKYVPLKRPYALLRVLKL
ncbi:hypothetical protein AOLI_G00178700 [Acnodon oligacanthus]